jgi:glycosyltransferase involved in cell wall biosynthesis
LITGRLPATAPADRPLKVAALVREIGPAGGGGAERVARDLLVELDPERFERVLFLSRPPDPGDQTGELVVADLRRRGVAVRSLRRRFKYDPLAWWPLFQALRRERIDVLHTHAFGQNAWGSVIGRLTHVPVVIAHEHNWAFTGRALRPVIDRELIARCASAMIVVSREARRRMVEVERVAPEKLTLLPNGIRALPPGDGRAVRAELGIGDDDPVIGTVCVIRSEKALDVLVRAAALVVRDFPRLRVLIVGDGPDRASVEAVVGQLGLEQRVLFTGARTDVANVLAAMDVAVLSSDYEGIPLSILEFMDAGKPIVATRVGGIPEVIEDGVHGVLVPPRDEAALAAAVSGVLRGMDAGREMGARARDRCRREFGLDRIVQRLERLYAQLHSRRGAIPRSAPGECLDAMRDSS